MDDNRDERGGASGAPAGPAADGSRPPTRRELRLAALAREQAAEASSRPPSTGPVEPAEPGDGAAAADDAAGPDRVVPAAPAREPAAGSGRRAAPQEPAAGPPVTGPGAGRAIGQLARAAWDGGAPTTTGPLPTTPSWTPVGHGDGAGAGRTRGGGAHGEGAPGDGGRTPASTEPEGDPGAPARPPVTRRRVREAVRDAPAPSVAAATGALRTVDAVDESTTRTAENPVVPERAAGVPAPRPAGDAPGAGSTPPEVPPPGGTPGTEPAAAPERGTVPEPEPAPEPAPGTGPVVAVEPGAVAEPGAGPTVREVDDATGVVPGPASLPTVLPEEPDVDDVRWDGPVPPSQVVRTPVARRAVPRVAPPPDDVAATGPVPPVQPDTATAPAAPVRPAEGAGPRREPVPSFGPTWTVRGPATATPSAAAGTPVPGTAAVEPTPVEVPVLRARAAEGAVDGGALPTLDDLLASRPSPAQGPAELGWRAVVRRATGGLLALPPGPVEQRVRESVAAVQRPLDGPRTVVVINPKGGAHKTTATLLLAATFGTHRGGSTLAWDNNETRGTLGWRSQHGVHQRTAVDLLDDLHRFEDPTARVGDLDPYVRPQSAQFDVLASDEDAASAASIDAFAFRSLHRTLQRFYRVLVVDTGNNMRASNWQAAIEAADQVVVVSTVREDTSQSAAWALDALRAAGKEDVVRRAVTVLSDPATRRDAALHQRLHDHFGRLTRVVLDVPYDPSLVAGGPLDVEALSRETREAWLHVAAAVADGL